MKSMIISKLSFIFEHHQVELMAWTCRLLFSPQDFKEWCCRISIVFVLYNTLRCLFGPKGDTSGPVRRRRGARALVERVKQLPFLCSGYAVAAVSCYIVVVKSSVAIMFDSLLDSGVGSFYDLVVDPLSSHFENLSLNDSRSAHRTHVPRHHGIPGRHNGRRATKRSRARPPPFRGSCVRRTITADPEAKKKKKSKPSVPDFPPKRLARCELAYQRRLAISRIHKFVDPDNDDPIGQDLTITNLFGNQIDFSWFDPAFSSFVTNFKYGSDADESTPGVEPVTSFWKTKISSLLLPLNRRLQECASLLQECHFYFVADSESSSVLQRRSDNHNNHNSSIHSYVLVGKSRKVRKGNDTNNVRFSRKVERAIKNRNVMNLTGEDGVKHSKWLVGDSGAGCSVIADADLLTDIHDAPDGKTMTIHCNSGTTTTSKRGYLKGYGLVWHDPNGIANIISLGECSTRYRITMDTNIDNALYVHKPNGSVRRFECTKDGIYCCDMRSTSKQKFMFNITTVEGQEQQYSALDVSRAKEARKLQDTMGFISERDLLHMIDNNLIIGSKVRRRDVIIANDIYGANVNSLKGKTVRKTEKHVREDATMDVPPYIMDRYSKISLSADIMYVNGVAFFVAISRHIKHISVIPIQKKNHKTMLSCIDKLKASYELRGFTITNLFMDNEFECLRSDLKKEERKIELNCVAADEHEPNIERSIRHMKERCRCTFASLNFKRLPRRLVVELVCTAVFWINSNPRLDGVHPTLSPRAIMTGHPLTIKNVEFQYGEFVQATEPSKTNSSKNNMDERTSDAIYCRPSGNHQGGFWVYKLSTAQLVHRNTAKPAHSSEAVAEQVERIAANEKMPTGLTFGDRYGNTTISDYDTDPDNDRDDDVSDGEYSDDGEELDDDHSLTSFQSVDEGELEDHDEVNGVENQGDHFADVGGNHSESEYDGESSEDDSNNDGSDENPGVGSDENLGVGSDEDPGVGRREGNRRSSRDRQEPERFAESEHSPTFSQVSYSFFQAVTQYQNIDATMSTKQYGMKAGLKVFGDAGLDAVASEIRDNLHGRGVIEPVKRELVTHSIRKQSLPYLMFLKRKRCGKIKGRGCADGRKQREFISKEEASSPTVSTPALMVTCLIDAIEGRNVATADIPGAFLQATMDDDVWIKFENEMVDVLVELDPERYGPCVCHHKGRRFIYAKAIKAIYGAMKSALLFYNLFSGQLIEWGFKKNDYDACTMNKMVNGSQLTIVWHVDDCKISHVDEKVVTDMLNKLEQKFGKESAVTVTRGPVHDYLGMTIDYSEEGKVKFYMFDYIEQILSEVDSKMMGGPSVTPAAKHLFTVNDSAVKLSRKEADAFHRNVARLLFLSKRARPDLQTAVAFLCTRVKSPDVDDNKKLGRVMRHLRETIFLPLVLGWDGTGNTYWSVDASFAVHNDMRSHTGGVMTFGNGAMMSISTKQKLNTTSSTEAELVGVSDSLPFNLWAAHFITSQGIGVSGYKLGKNNILYQDNESSIKIEVNGKASCSKRTRHINIRYFAITDRVKKKEIEILYCPTGEMLGDFYTKPLQGGLYVKFRNSILGITDAKYIEYRKAYYEAKAAKESVTSRTKDG